MILGLGHELVFHHGSCRKVLEIETEVESSDSSDLLTYYGYALSSGRKGKESPRAILGHVSSDLSSRCEHAVGKNVQSSKARDTTFEHTRDDAEFDQVSTYRTNLLSSIEYWKVEFSVGNLFGSSLHVLGKTCGF